MQLHSGKGDCLFYLFAVLGIKMIKINDYSVQYPSGYGFKVDKLVIPSRGAFLIVGDNGAGKSTLIRSILYLFRGFQGSIFIDERDNREFKRREMARKISYLPQNTVQIPDMPAIDFIRQGFYALQDGNLEETVAVLGVDRYLHRNLSELSGGERQLCRLARALVAETPYTLLDEPDSFLSRKNKLRFFEITERIARRRSLVIVSHSEQDFHRFDKILEMEEED